MCFQKTIILEGKEYRLSMKLCYYVDWFASACRLYSTYVVIIFIESLVVLIHLEWGCYNH